MRKLIKADGSEQEFEHPLTMPDITKMIAASCLDAVALKHLGQPLHVMMVDDTGLCDGKPINEKATELYHLNCRPGAGPIAGDVVIVLDEDFA